jgi:hypothetical protein
LSLCRKKTWESSDNWSILNVLFVVCAPFMTLGGGGVRTKGSARWAVMKLISIVFLKSIQVLQN